MEYLEGGQPQRRLLTKEQWHQAVELAIEESQAQGGPLSVLIIDVNYFKDINDTLGHDEGDRVIAETKELISILLDSIRLEARHETPEDLIGYSKDKDTARTPVIDTDNKFIVDAQGGHIGGDEFAVLAHTDEVGTAVICERLRQKFVDYVNQPQNELLRNIDVNIAIGSSTLAPNMDKKAFLKKADQDMYKDKNSQLPPLDGPQLLALKAAETILKLNNIRPRHFPKYIRIHSEAE